VYGAGFDQQTVPDCWLKLIQTICTISAGQRLLDRGAVDARSQTGIDATAGLRSEHDPGFGFSQVGRIEFGRLFIIWVNLNGERLLTVEILKK
jgi:hypothetical protein